jgi:predicted DsbA family dithiol-disulfide isomerase
LRASGGPGIFRPPPPVSGPPVPVVVFSDFACPYSYVAEAALARMEAAGEVRTTPLAFLLPAAPAPETWRTPLAPIAEALGIRFGADPPPGGTRKAHEAAAFAASRGAGPAFRAAVFVARFGEGRDVGRVDVLVELGAAVGLDATELKVVLDVDTFAARIAAEHDAAVRAGVEGVPTLVAGEGAQARWWVGARPPDELRRWILESD